MMLMKSITKRYFKHFKKIQRSFENRKTMTLTKTYKAKSKA